MKKIIRIICLVLILSALLAVPVFATGDQEFRASNYFAGDSCYLYKTSGSSFQIWFEVKGMDIMDEIGASTVILQRSPDGKNWSNVKTYTRDLYPQLIGTNTGYHSCGLPTYYGSLSYQYRAYVEFYAKKGTGSAGLPRYTSPVLMTADGG